MKNSVAAPARTKVKVDPYEAAIVAARDELEKIDQDAEVNAEQIEKIKVQLEEARAERDRIKDALARGRARLTRKERQHATFLVGELTAALMGQGLAVTPQAILDAAKEVHRDRIAAFFRAAANPPAPPELESAPASGKNENMPNGGDRDVDGQSGTEDPGASDQGDGEHSHVARSGDASTSSTDVRSEAAVTEKNGTDANLDEQTLVDGSATANPGNAEDGEQGDQPSNGRPDPNPTDAEAPSGTSTPRSQGGSPRRRRRAGVAGTEQLNLGANHGQADGPTGDGAGA